MKVFKKAAVIIITVIFAILFIFFSEKVSESIVRSIYLCIDTIIPSMFTFMVLSTYIISSGIYKWIFHPIYIIFNRFIKLDKELFSVFCLSLIGGYPIGIKILKECISQNNNFPEIYTKLSLFCYCISPTFSITMIGLGLFRSFEAGLIIYISNVISCTIAAIIISNHTNLKCHSENNTATSGLVNAVNSSSSSLLIICTVIIIFNAGITAFEELIAFAGLYLPVQIKSILEISNVLDFNTADISMLPFISALASSGGICVIFQCFSLAGKDLNKRLFLIGRILIAFISSLITNIILKFWNISLPAVTGSVKYSFEFNAQRLITVLLIIMCAFLMKKSEKIFKKG